MELWQQVDWKHRLERPAVNAFSRTFGMKLAKSGVLEVIAPTLDRSRHWIVFDGTSTVYSAVSRLVDHVVETYGLEVFMKGGELHKTASERSWALPDDPQQGARAMAALRQAEPMLEPRPFVNNGSSDQLCWAVFSSTDWAELEAADLYATRALFPIKGQVPKAPVVATVEEVQRARTPEHEALLVWAHANKPLMIPQLVLALEALETSLPGSTQERDAASRIYRLERRARR